MNDEDFVELCSTWEAQRFGYIDTERIESLYSKLSLKPVFKENEIFKDMYGHFLKSVHSLFDGDFYTHDFFKIDR